MGKSEKKRTRHFVTVLGTGNYKECSYEIQEDDFQYSTPFVQMAVMKYIMPQDQEGDRITVLLTEKARDKNWYSSQRDDQERRTGLKELIEDAYPNAEAEAILIPEGRNQKEVNEIFEEMYEVIQDGEDVYFDFTHSLRNIPMQVLTVIHYAKSLKNIRVGGMFYGAFELGEDDENGFRHVPLIDMTVCSTILDWTSAANSFVKSGSSNLIPALYNEQIRSSKKAMSELAGNDLNSRQARDNNNMIRALLQSIQTLTGCLETSRGNLLKEKKTEKKSIWRAYQDFKRKYNNLKDSRDVMAPPLARLVRYIGDDLKIFDQEIWIQRGDERICLVNTSIGMAAVEWAKSKNLTQQGFTALEETMKTYIYEKYKMEERSSGKSDIRNIREMINDILKILGSLGKNWDKEESANDKSRQNQRESVYQKWYEEQMQKRRKVYENLTDSEKQALKEIIFETETGFALISYSVSEMRNTLNHFGFQTNPSDYDQIQKQLDIFYKKARESMKADGAEWGAE